MFVILEEFYYFFLDSQQHRGLEELVALLMCGLQQELRKGSLKENQSGFGKEPSPNVWEGSGEEDEEWGGGEVKEGNKRCVWYFHTEKKPLEERIWDASLWKQLKKGSRRLHLRRG